MNPRHFPARPYIVPYVPPPPDVPAPEPDDLAEGLDAPLGIVNGILLATIFWLIVGAWWASR